VRALFALVSLALAVYSLTACDRRSASPAPAAVTSAAAATTTAAASKPDDNPLSPWLSDGKPQSGLPRIKLFLGAKELNTELALTTEAIQKGMMWRTNVPETDAMLFVFGRPHQTAFWMKNVPMDIDVAYLDPEGAILEIHKLNRQDTNPVPAKVSNVQFALETAVGWFQRNGIGPGVLVRTERGSLQETFFRKAPAR
jgi:uncharacterized membrane protein (UPF0127 family)